MFDSQCWSYFAVRVVFSRYGEQTSGRGPLGLEHLSAVFLHTDFQLPQNPTGALPAIPNPLMPPSTEFITTPFQ